MAGSSSQDSFTPLSRFLRLLSPDRKEIGYIYLYAVLIGLLSLASPLGVQAIINLIAGGDFNASLVVLVITVTSAGLFVGVLRVMQKVVAETIQRRLFARASLEFSYRLPRIKLEAFKDIYPPELVNRFFDTVNIQKGLPKILLDFSAAIMQIFFGLVLISFYNSFFGFLGLVSIAILSITIFFLYKPSMRTSLQESKYKYSVASWLEDIARANNTFKLAGGKNLTMQRTDSLVTGYLKSRGEHFSYLIRHYVSLLIIQSVVVAGFLMLGGFLVIENQINIGQFVAAELVILSMVSNLEKVVYTFETVYDTLTGVEKIAAITDMPLEEGGQLSFDSVDTGVGLEVELSNLCFSYPRSGDKALKGISLEIASGERFCLAGFNRSGRTTMIQLLSGLRLDFTGRLAYNKTPIGNFNLDTLREVIGDFTPQEDIIPASITDNICLGHPSVSFADIQWAIELSGLDSWISEQSEGYETILVAQGLDLPRSVRTRLLIARAIVRRPRLLLIGSLLEQLEPALRTRITANLTDKKYTWTLVIASNDPAVAKQCDRVGVLQGGSLIALGIPSEVLQKREITGVWSGSLV